MTTVALILAQGAAITMSQGREQAAWAGCMQAVRVGLKQKMLPRDSIPG